MTQRLFNSKKNFQHLFILHGINTNSASGFMLLKKIQWCGIVKWCATLYLFRMQWFYNLPIMFRLFTYPFNSTWLRHLKEVLSSGNCKCKECSQKSFHLAKLVSIYSRTICSFVQVIPNNPLTFDVLYWVSNVTKKRVNKMRFVVPPRLLHAVFRNSPLFVRFSSFLPPCLMLLHLFLEIFSPAD